MEFILKDNYGNDIKVGYVVVLGTTGSKLRKAIVSSIKEWKRWSGTSVIKVTFRTVGFDYGKLTRGSTNRYIGDNNIIPEVMFISDNIEKAFPECNITTKLVTKITLK